MFRNIRQGWINITIPTNLLDTRQILWFFDNLIYYRFWERNNIGRPANEKKDGSTPQNFSISGLFLSKHIEYSPLTPPRSSTLKDMLRILESLNFTAHLVIKYMIPVCLSPSPFIQISLFLHFKIWDNTRFDYSTRTLFSVSPSIKTLVYLTFIQSSNFFFHVVSSSSSTT